MGEPTVEPVVDWASDFDVLDPRYVEDPYPIWDELRRTCPVAATQRRGPTYLLTRHADVVAAAADVEHFSSRRVSVIPVQGDPSDPDVLPYGLPPISADAPLHPLARRALVPWFSYRRIQRHEEAARRHCRELTAALAAGDTADAAADYARRIPVVVVGRMLGVPAEDTEPFAGWVSAALEHAHDRERRREGTRAMLAYLYGELARRAAAPPAEDDDSLLGTLLRKEIGGEPIELPMALGMVTLVLIAGIDTTWSAIGAALLHLGTHPADRDRLVAEPAAIPRAVEELLRAYSPVTMARYVRGDVELAGCPLPEGAKLLLSFPAANRDPAAFERPDEVDFDREDNHHVAFGSGIHRCLGAYLARMELRVAIEEWLASFPAFRLQPGARLRWSGGQVRGPRSVPVLLRG